MPGSRPASCQHPGMAVWCNSLTTASLPAGGQYTRSCTESQGPDTPIICTRAQSMSEQFRLLKKKRFAPLFITQFLSAFNDNLFKNALVVLLTFHTAQWSTLSAGVLANLAAGIFILPFFLFSAFAGQLADKYDKAKLARLTKLLELVITLVALWGSIEHSLYILLSALFLLGLQSTLFGPVKYSLLPQHLKQSEIGRASCRERVSRSVAAV